MLGVHLKREQLCSAKRDLTQHHRINIVVVDESSPPCELVKFSTVSQVSGGIHILSGLLYFGVTFTMVLK